MYCLKNLLVRARSLFLLGVTLLGLDAFADTNLTVRFMAANLNGDAQTYQPFALRIFQGLKPDIVAIQEFNYGANTPADFRSMLDTAFGTDFVYFRENYAGIPNGIISRYPIVDSGSWVDTVMSSPNRGFAWAKIALPGTNVVYVVSVHLLTSSSANRAAEAVNLTALMKTNFGTNAWVVLGGDFNTDSRTESAMTTFKTILSDNPIPVDNNGNSNTSMNRNHPHDYVMPSFFLTNFESPSVFTSHSFPSGLVFDSRVYTPLSDVAPVQQADSGLAQHMGVLKDFTITVSTGDGSTPPVITTHPQSQSADVGSNVTFTVVATSTNALTYQWKFNNSNIGGATNDSVTITNVQAANAGSYKVLVANSGGTVTSSNAVLTVNTAPIITSQPSSNTVFASQSATFTVVATGGSPLSYQWTFNAGTIADATNSTYTRTNAQTGDQGNYAVVITNYLGSVTSINAGLLVTTQAVGTIAQWNFNSLTSDADTTTGVLTPSVGSGTVAYVGGTAANTTGFAGGSTVDPNTTDNSAWNTTTYPASTAGNKTAGVQFNVSTAGKQNIVVRWDLRASPTGSKYFRLLFSTNGTTFSDFPTAVSLVTSNTFEAKTNNLSALAGVNDNSNFAFRIVAEFQATATGSGGSNYVAAGSTSTYAGTGTTRFDMVTVSGSLLPVAPTITNQPTDQVAVQGASATFSVGANGTAPTYQWQLASVNIPGAISSSYTRSNVQPGDEGPYSVIVSNSAGVATSSNAFLTILVPPSIVDQPVDQFAAAGLTASFSVNAAGSDPLTYQWQLASTNLPNQTNATLSLNVVDNSQAGLYSVIVTNAAGSVTSSNAVLTVYPTAAASLSSAQWVGGQFQMNVTGVPGYNYAVLVSTNLFDWLSVQTNTAPFSFTDPQSGSDPQRFYRTIYLP